MNAPPAPKKPEEPSKKESKVTESEDESEKPESEKMFNIWELVLYPVSRNYFEDRELKFRIPVGSFFF
uniref:Uncharacterized protein n=1 Tax=Bursaphelenchus xylophilus TaxID=6326 RepID=A0A1I7SPR0_BURXY